MEQISIESLYGAVKSNCLPRRVDGRSYESIKSAPYLSLAVMRILMTSAGYSDDQIKLELGVEGFTWDRLSDEIDDFLSEKNKYLGTKVLLCQNYLRLNYSTKLAIKL